jgi:hypothetical protein
MDTASYPVGSWTNSNIHAGATCLDRVSKTIDDWHYRDRHHRTINCVIFVIVLLIV